MTSSTGTAVHGAGDGAHTSSLVELLLELSHSVTYNRPHSYSRGDHTGFSVEPHLFACVAGSATRRFHNPTKLRRKRRRDVLNIFFDPSNSVYFLNGTRRTQMRKMFHNAKENIRQVAETYAAMLELLCGAVAPDITTAQQTHIHNVSNTDDDTLEMSETELMLYIILRTSIAAAPTWQKPPITPRCWLSPSITAIVERSPALQQTMRWSCDPDPIIDAALTADAPGCNFFSFGGYTSYRTPSLLAYYMDTHSDTAAALASTSANSNNTTDSHGVGGAAWPQSMGSSRVGSTGGTCSHWSGQEGVEVRHLFARKHLESSVVQKVEGGRKEEEEEESVVPSSRNITFSRPLFSFFKEEYPSSFPFCSLLFVALHRGMIGQQDPYLLLRLEYGNDEGGDSFSLASPPSSNGSPYGFQRVDAYNRFSVMQPIGISVSSEFLIAAGKHRTDKGKSKNVIPVVSDEREKTETHNLQYSRGVVTMLEWSCQSGTLFLRLQYLCEVSGRSEWRAALGQYGKSAIEALRRVLLLLLRRVSDLSDRPGGPHSITFRELLEARQELQYIEEDIIALSDVFLVNGEAGWSPSTVLREFSSATLLSALFTRYTSRNANYQCYDGHSTKGTTTPVDDKGGKLDVIGEIFLAVLNPLNRMMSVWLRRGELQDPYDEFFILPSHGTTDCGFLVDASAQRLPNFISLETAENILHAGVSLCILRSAAQHVIGCAKKYQVRLSNQTEDVDVAITLHDQMDDAMRINWLLSNFTNALFDLHPLPSSSSSSSLLPLSSPEVNLLQEEGTLSYWRDFYGACNRLLLSPGGEGGGEEEEEDEQQQQRQQQRNMPVVKVIEVDESDTCDTLLNPLGPGMLGQLEDEEAMVRKNNPATGENGEMVVVTTTATAASTLSTAITVTPTTIISPIGGNIKYGSTIISRISRATTAWHEAVSEEFAQVTQVTNEEEVAESKSRTELRLEYERHVLRKKAQRQLQQWKARRLSLNLERAAALSRCVDDLQGLYLCTLKPPTKTGQESSYRGDNEEQEENEQKGNVSDREDGRKTPIGKFVKPLLQLPLPPPSTKKSTTVGRAKFALFRSRAGNGDLLEEDEPASNTTSLVAHFRPILLLQPRQEHRRRASVSKTLNSSLQLGSSCKGVNASVGEGPCEFIHAPEMYVVADINDEEYLKKRSGPHVSDKSVMETALVKLEAQEVFVQGPNVSSEAYQKKCVALAREALYSMGENVDVVDGDDTNSHSHNNNHTDGKNKFISNAWWTNPTADEEVLRSYKENSVMSGKTSAVTVCMTEQQMRMLPHCSSYYLRLSRYTASYLTHKALQVMLLGPYGTLYRLMQQLLDVCLMQRGSVADRLTGIWQHLTKESIEENQFNASSAFTILNRVFVEEWESSVMYGGDTLLHIRLALSIPDDDDNENEESNREGAYLMAGKGERNSSSGLLFRDTAFQRRAQRPPSMFPMGINAEDYWNERGKREQRGDEREDGKKEQQDVLTLSLPDNPFDFISQLTIVHDTPREEFWLLPKDAIAIYGDLFSTLLFWISVTQLVTRVWFIGIKSGVSEAFYFCNVTRAVLGAVAQHMWFLIAGYAREYRQTLRFESGVLYGYQRLDCFTRDHAVFLERCRFAAMLTPAFVRARQQVYGMVRQLEEVEQCMLAAAEYRRCPAVSSTRRTSTTATSSENPGGGASVDGKKRQRTNKPEEKGNVKQNAKRSKKTGVVCLDTRGSGGSSSRETTVERPRGKSPRQQLETRPQKKEVRQRNVRDVLQRRLRSFLGLTEIFINHLTAVRDSDMLDDAEELFPQRHADEEQASVPSSGRARTSAAAAALTSLIRTLEMTKGALSDKF